MTQIKRLSQTLPVSYLLLTYWGRISRLSYLNAQLFIWLTFYILFNIIDYLLGYSFTIIIYPLLYWVLFCTAAKRLHDTNISSWFLLAMLIPIIGPLWLFYRLVLKRSFRQDNKYGTVPGSTEDYLTNDDAQEIPLLKTDERIVNDVTGLNPIIVSQVIKPQTIEEIQHLVKSTNRAISVGGGRFSMGGQTASHQSLHIDLRGMNNVIEFSKENKTIKVQAGIRWCDIQQNIDEHDLSIKIMQTYANFTVGGSLSVNAHGRYMGQGPLILSVNSIDIVLADGSLVHATPDENSEIFYGAIGGYNGLGIIVQAELQLSDNVKVKRVLKKMPRNEYHDYFTANIRDNPKAVFHNADMYPPHYLKLNSGTWEETSDKLTVATRLMPLKDSYPVERYFLWAFSETPFGKWRREHIIEPIFFFKKRVHWKNYEAGYDVAELEPKSRIDQTYVLLEYFVPVNQFEKFSGLMAEIFQRHRVNVINVSVRHAQADPGSYLAWAREEVFAFVIYYKQSTEENARHAVAVWTRELIDAVISVNGTYYLPYQVHATPQQFHVAYPNAKKLFALKDKFDPNFKFRNIIWDTYYKTEKKMMVETESEFIKVFSDTKWSDKFYKFLQVIFHLYPEDKFHHLIKKCCEEKTDDESIYKLVQSKLPQIKPFFSLLTLALPALKKQKKEMTKQTLQILDNKAPLNGYLEIGSTGRYIGHLKKHHSVNGNIYLMNDRAPDNSIGEIFERGQLKQIGTFFDLDYDPIKEEQIPSESLDVVTCFIGLHHCPEEKLEAFVKSIVRILRPGGKFIMRDHDVTTPEMATFVSLVHTVFNLGLNETWEFNNDEYRSFKSIDDWCQYLSQFGFVDSGKRILQENDPSDNTLVLLTKEST
ncbi:FAD-binding protein [Gimesia aquarii]|uniref:Putative xylitol oxidase n=1 Tax=Gimesia aquarii TaxID=2527964 RepID=A0A517W1Y1_9PLAN|nr:FAD-binding protein [Gimesia aquarii]QDT99247.1 putative xylitol oxidase [Gimesia aquarii]